MRMEESTLRRLSSKRHLFTRGFLTKRAFLAIMRHFYLHWFLFAKLYGFRGTVFVEVDPWEFERGAHCE